MDCVKVSKISESSMNISLHRLFGKNELTLDELNIRPDIWQIIFCEKMRISRVSMVLKTI